MGEQEVTLSTLIPYSDDDQGYRPLPAQYPIYACESIQPNGIKGSNTYPGRGPSNKFKTTVKVRVQGVWRPGVVNVLVTYNNFGTISWGTLLLFGSERFGYTSDGDYTVSIEGFIRDNAPPHICMLALAYSVDDHYVPEESQPQSGLDKHWAQLNLADISVPVAASGRQPFAIQFNVGNPSNSAQAYLLKAQVSTGVELDALRSLTGKRILDPNDVLFAFRDESTGDTSSAKGDIQTNRVSLGAREDRGFSLFGSIGPSLTQGDRFAISVNQYTGMEDDPNTRVGGCAILVTVS
jgi:hypothetical protein